ncbi:alpha-glucosidase [termite gut metagenome]|uniref:Alpha-glucosidase n=1 Tax=termite gut metagenome TaxID=433724 RepID=A0A5J4SWU1_9ZZZZ
MNYLIHLRKSLALLFLIGTVFTVQAQKPIELVSPDGNIKVSVVLGDKIYYTISDRNEVLLQNNEMQLQFRNETFGKNPKLISRKSLQVDADIQPTVPLKFAIVKNRYNQLILNFQGNYSVEFRAFDDGVAYRFISRKKGIVEVMHEDFNLNFPAVYQLHLQQGGFNTNYEEPYKHLQSKDVNVEDPMILLPLLIDTQKGTKILISEADLNDYPNMFLRGHGEKNSFTSVFSHAPLKVKTDGRNINVVEEADYIARITGIRAFPWRYFIIAGNDCRLVESTMVCRLSPSTVLNDVSWIKPGLVMWDWMNRWTDYGPEVNYKAGVNTAAYKHYIDFSARNNIPYLVVDEGWSKDYIHLKEVIPNVDLPELVSYGKAKNVGIILWVTYSGIEADLLDDSYNIFEHYSKMGIKGFKIDFMDRNDQDVVNFYKRAAKEAAENHLLLEFHGNHKPTGLEYQYPNVLSYEGVRGLENRRTCTPDNSIYFPFMRNILGPMSFTPGSMLNVQPENFGNGLPPNMVQIGTRVYHMAAYIVFESGLQMIADSPRQFDQNPDCSQFIFSTPVTWDETRALVAQVGEYVVVAKRRGEKWWIGGITNNAQKLREFDITLDFLPPGTFNMTAFEDGLNADSQAMDYDVRKTSVKQGDKIHIKMARNGGWAAVIE